MNKVQEIEKTVRGLTPDDLSAFRAWFTEFDAVLWDEQFENDVANSRLDTLAQEALLDFSKGRCTDL